MILWRHYGRSVAEVLILFWRSEGRAAFKNEESCMKHEDEVLKESHHFCHPLTSNTHIWRFVIARVSHQQCTPVSDLLKSFRMKSVLSIRSSSFRQPSRQINVSHYPIISTPKCPHSTKYFCFTSSEFHRWIWCRSWGWCKTWSGKPCQFRIRQSERRERFSIIANSRPTTPFGIRVSSHFDCIP